MKKTIAFILFTNLGVSLFAQEVRPLSLQDAFQLAIQNSKQLQLDSLKMDAVDLKKDQTKSAMIPILGLTSAYTRLSDNIDPFTIAFPGMTPFEIQTNFPNQFMNVATVKQPLFQGLKNLNALKAYDQQLQATQFDSKKNQDELKFAVVQAYYTLYKLEQINVLLDSNIAQTQSRIDDLQRMKKAGLILNNDVMRAELQKTQFLVNKTDIESGIEIANYNLNILLGNHGEIKYITEKPEEVATEKQLIPSLIDNAVQSRPELKAQSFRSHAMDYQVKASKSAYMPTISFAANAQYNRPNQRVFPPVEEFKSTWDVGLTLNWNIMQLYSAKAIVNESKNQKAQIDLATEQMKDGIYSEVNANYQALQVSLSKINLAEQAIEQASENKRILDNQFDAKVALLTDVLDADVFLLQAQTNLLSAKADAAIDYYKLQKSIGNIE